MNHHKSTAILLGALVHIISFGCRTEPTEQPGEIPLAVVDIWNPVETLDFSFGSEDQGVSFEMDDSGYVSLFCDSPESTTVELRAQPYPWNLSQYSGVALEFTNAGQELVRVHAVLRGARDHPNRYGPSSQICLKAGESGKLVIPFGFRDDEYESDPAFESVAMKPNGRRVHWNPYPTDKIHRMELVVEGTTNESVLGDLRVSPVFPQNTEQLPRLESLPMLDRFGQLRALQWPGKLESVDDLKQRDLEEAYSEEDVRRDDEKETSSTLVAKRDHTGAAGRYTTKKIDGKWWFVTPDGKPFWSIGINSIGVGSPIRIWKRRHLYEWAPGGVSGPFAGAYEKRNGVGFVDFYRANLIRRFGREHRSESAKRTINRITSWGVNTLGVGSDDIVRSDSELPYVVLIQATKKGHYLFGNLPDPFSPEFLRNLDQSIQTQKHLIEPASRCIGVFIDADQIWPQELVARVLESDSRAREAFLDYLIDEYDGIDALNNAWKASFRGWDSVRITSENTQRMLAAASDFSSASVENSGRKDREEDSRFDEDIQAMQRIFADRYFSACAASLQEHLPNVLYLGSRFRFCSPRIAAICADHADVVSFNCYYPRANCGSLPTIVDKPVIVSRFHFGAMDAGVPAMGNRVAFDQVQRARMYAGYMVSAMKDPRIVGAHWDAYVDQCMAAQPGKGNHVGWVDITDKPYEELTLVSKRLADSLRKVRTTGNKSELQILDELLSE